MHTCQKFRCLRGRLAAADEVMRALDKKGGARNISLIDWLKMSEKRLTLLSSIRETLVD